MNDKYQEFIGKELSRKDFLKFIGGGIVVLFGMSNFINYLSHFHRTGTPKVAVEANHGFGTRKFGN